MSVLTLTIILIALACAAVILTALVGIWRRFDRLESDVDDLWGLSDETLDLDKEAPNE